MLVEKTAAFRRRRAADTARWRKRLRRGKAVYPVEVDETTFQLMERFAGLNPGRSKASSSLSAPTCSAVSMNRFLIQVS
jgi:hypothetical protein